MIGDLEEKLTKKIDRKTYLKDINDKASLDEISNVISSMVENKFKKVSRTAKEVEKASKTLQEEKKKITGQIEKFIIKNELQKVDEALNKPTSVAPPPELSKFEDRISSLEPIFDLCTKKDILLKEEYESIQDRLDVLEEGLEYLQIIEFKKRGAKSEIDAEIEKIRKERELAIQEMEQRQKSNSEYIVNSLLKSHVIEENTKFKKVILEEVKSLKKTFVMFKRVMTGFRKTNAKDMNAFSARIEMIISQLHKDNIRFVESLKKENLDNFDNIKDVLSAELSSELEQERFDISSLSSQVISLMNSQEILSKESENLMTQICKKDNLHDEKIENLFKKLEYVEEQFIQSQAEQLKQHSEPSTDDSMAIYSMIQTKLDDKISTGEIQVALNDLQGKVEIMLRRTNQNCFEVVETLKKRYENNLKVLVSKLEKKQEIVNNSTLEKQLFSQVQNIRDQLENYLTINDFEMFLSINKSSIKEIQDKLLGSVDKATFLRMIDTKVGKFTNN